MMGGYSIRPVPLYTGPRDMSQWTYLMNYGQRVETCHYVWYIEGSSPRILVDAGADAELSRANGFSEDDDIQSVEQGLRKIGLKPEDIEIVILTHLHADHVALAGKFNKARFIVQKAELEFALNPHPVHVGNYDSSLFNGLDLEVIEGDKEIIDGVRVFLTPGHSPGAQSVAVETPGGTAVITGFCCTLDNFNPPPQLEARGCPVVAPSIHTDALQAYDSALKVKQVADIILPAHEAAFIDRDRIP